MPTTMVRILPSTPLCAILCAVMPLELGYGHAFSDEWR
jgi:hypothetical protein